METIGYVAAKVTITAASFVFMGACLSVGFWMGKTLTNRIDSKIAEHRILNDKKLMEELKSAL